MKLTRYKRRLIADMYKVFCQKFSLAIGFVNFFAGRQKKRRDAATKLTTKPNCEIFDMSKMKNCLRETKPSALRLK